MDLITYLNVVEHVGDAANKGSKVEEEVALVTEDSRRSVHNLAGSGA